MTTDGNGGLVTSMQLHETTGVSYRVLDYWVRVGVLRPEIDSGGPGSRRMFAASQVAQVATLARVWTALSTTGLGVSTLLMGDVMEAIERGDDSLDLGHDVRLTWRDPAWR